MRKRKTEGGFTIVELLVTIVFIGVAFMAVSDLFLNLSSLNRQAYNLIDTTYLAQQKIETYRQTPYSSIPTGTPAVDFTSELPARLGSPKSAYINIVETETGLKRIDVFISYKDGLTKNVEQTTLVTEQGINR